MNRVNKIAAVVVMFFSAMATALFLSVLFFGIASGAPVVVVAIFSTAALVSTVCTVGGAYEASKY